MSSRSLAAARSRRAGENVPPVSGNRPVTSIGSYAAFGQQPPNLQPNVRVAKAPQNTYQQQPPQNTYQQSQPPPPQQVNPNGLPFTKLSISDAIGLITIRLGRVEQWIIETDHENEENDHQNNSNHSNNFDNSILTSFASRLDSLEKREPVSGSSSEEVTKLVEDVGKMNVHLAKIVEESSKHSLMTAKHTEQLFRFERELIETKDILKTFMLKYDQFASETSDKFCDFEYVISELEKNIPVNEEGEGDEEEGKGEDEAEGKREEEEDGNEGKGEGEDDEGKGEEGHEEGNEGQPSIMRVDLKTLVKKELATSIL